MAVHLQRSIETLKKMLLSLSAQVEESLHKAVQAVMERNAELAQDVIASDRVIDEKEVEVEEQERAEAETQQS